MLASLLCGLALALAAGFVGDWWSPLEMASHARLHVGAAASISAVAALGLRRRRLALAAALCAATAAAGLGPAPHGAARAGAPGAAGTITIAAANVFRDNAASDAAQAAIAALDADVVVLVEAGPDFRRDYAVLRRGRPHSSVRAGFPDEPQVAVFSRFPIVEDRRRPHPPYLPQRLSVRIDLGGGTELDIAGLHLGRSFGGAVAGEVETLADVVTRWRHPMVVIGDFNATPWSRPVAAIAGLTGTVVVGGLRPTWLPAAAPGWLRVVAGLPIDHALVSPEVGVDWARSFHVPGSDHRGLVLQVRAPLLPGG